MSRNSDHGVSRACFLVIALAVDVAACGGSNGAGGSGATGGGSVSGTGVTTPATSTNGSGSTTATAQSTVTTGSGVTSGGVGGAGDYCTNFDLVENPISEGGQWVQQGGLSGLDWTNVQTNNGIAFGTLSGNGGYNDSIALLSGFGADQRVTATIHFSGQRSATTSTHEVELILRGSYTPHSQHLYECNIGYSGAAGWYSQIVVLDGPIGTFTDITQGVGSVPDIVDGDVFSAEIMGDTIHTYINGILIATATDTTNTTGQPGVGFFWRATENVDDFGFTSFCATKL